MIDEKVVAKITAEQALHLLLEGNKKFCSEHYDVHPTVGEIETLVNGQHPYAAIVSCSDSRVPPNEVFNCDLGEIFVVRTAGNVVGDFELGSIEYSVDHLGTPLVMVLGHSNCGAVASAYSWKGGTGAIATIMDEVVPSVETARGHHSEKEDIIAKAEALNVENSVKKIKTSPIIAAMPGCAVVGAMYDIHTGEVTVIC